MLSLNLSVLETSLRPCWSLLAKKLPRCNRVQCLFFLQYSGFGELQERFFYQVIILMTLFCLDFPKWQQHHSHLGGDRVWKAKRRKQLLPQATPLQSSNVFYNTTLWFFSRLLLLMGLSLTLPRVTYLARLQSVLWPVEREGENVFVEAEGLRAVHPRNCQPCSSYLPREPVAEKDCPNFIWAGTLLLRF